jgi:hypothetical protein
LKALLTRASAARSLENTDFILNCRVAAAAGFAVVLTWHLVGVEAMLW